MKRLLVILASSIITLLTLPVIANAIGTFEDVCANVPAGQSSVCDQQNNNSDPLTGKEGDGIIIRSITLLARLTGIVSTLMIIVGSIKYITSRGDSNAVSSAKNTVMYAVIGLVIALFAQAILTFVISRVKKAGG